MGLVKCYIDKLSPKPNFSKLGCVGFILQYPEPHTLAATTKYPVPTPRIVVKQQKVSFTCSTKVVGLLHQSQNQWMSTNLRGGPCQGVDIHPLEVISILYKRLYLMGYTNFMHNTECWP